MRDMVRRAPERLHTYSYANGNDVAAPWTLATANAVTVVSITARDRAVSRMLHYAFFAAVFFPYIRVLPIGSDVQPTALVLGLCVFLASTTSRIPKETTPLLVVLVGAVLIAVITGVNATALRALANYFSLFIIAVATYGALKARRGLSTGFLSVTVWIWFFVGLIQTVVARSFLTFLLSNARSTANRGVVGLGPEPTSYGIHCLVLMILVTDLCTGRQRKWNLAALVIQILLFARSSMTVLFLALWGLAYLATRAGLVKSLIGAIFASALGLGILQALAHLTITVKGVRIFDIIRLVTAAPTLILVRDQSISDRVSAIVFSLAGAFQHWFLPHGFISWSAWVAEIGPRTARYIPYYTAGDRIMSGYGAAIFELGFLGLVIPYVVTRAASVRYARDRKRFITIGIVLNLLLLTAVPLAYPPIGFLIGYFCYYGIRTASELPDPTERNSFGTPAQASVEALRQ